MRYINHKSVSRKHATIHVGQIKPADSAHLYMRSEIKITDGSKIGTFVDGEKVCQTSKILDRTEYTIKLGHYEHAFHLKWQPVVLTFTSLSKSAKASSDPLEAHRKKLEHADIKLITEYVSNQTTHVIGKKRNTSPGLQALLQGRWLLAQSFVDALAQATAKPGKDANGKDRPCPLEENFEVNWPNEEEHILPAAGEPNPKPNEYLRPNPQRAELFAHATFIFLSQSQYDNLMPVVTSGSGKALLWDVEVGKSRPENLIGYVREVAGAKDDGDFRLSQHTGKGGIIIVRLDNKEKEWTTEFLRAVETTLEQRSMEQNQFLHAILSIDASELRKPLVRESQSQAQAGHSLAGGSERYSSRARERSRPTTPPAEPQAQESALNHSPPKTQQEPPQSTAMEATARKKPRRMVTQSRFKDFGKTEPTQFSRPASDSPEPEAAIPEEQSMQVDEPSYHEPSQRSSRKRPAPVDDDGAEAEKAFMDEMLPGAAAAKRRRTQKTQAKESEVDSSNATPEPETAPQAAKKKSMSIKKHKETDVGAKLKEQKEAAEEEERRQADEMREALEGDIEGIVAQTVDMDITRKPRKEPTETNNPAWFGRKDFKGFKRKGHNNDRPRLSRVIVALEEVPRRNHGIGDEYWLTSTSSKSQGKSKSQSQSQTQISIPHQNGDDDPTRFRRRLQNSRREDEEATQIMADFEEDGLPVRSTNGSAQPRLNATPRQTLGTESQRLATGKRSAPQQDGPAAKRAKQSGPASRRQPVTVVDDDDDAYKFRRKRR